MSDLFTAHPRPARWHRPVAVLFVLATLAGAMTDAVIGADAATHSVSGTAFQDLDRDGEHDTDEPVLAGERIALFSSAGALGSTVTDDRGHYQFSGLAAGTHRVAYDNGDWWELWADWVPTTMPGLQPSVVIEVTDATVVDFGWRQIVRSTDPAVPVDSFVGPSGLRAEVFNDAVSARELHDRAVVGEGGEERASTTVKLDISGSSTTSTSMGRTADGSYTNYKAVTYVSWMSWLQHADQTLGHEYGHVWGLYHAYVTQQDPDLTAYLEARGLADDARVGSTYLWSPRELLAEDYRQLLWTGPGTEAPQANTQLPPASEVPGLASFLRDEFTASAGVTDEPAPEPSDDPSPSPTPEPVPEPEPADTTAPAVTIASPKDGTSVASGPIVVDVGAADEVTATSALVVLGHLAGQVVTGTHDPATGRFTIDLDASGLKGTHTIEVEVTDGAGNTGIARSTVEFTKARGGGGGGSDKDTGTCRGRWC